MKFKIRILILGHTQTLILNALKGVKMIFHDNPVKYRSFASSILYLITVSMFTTVF